MPFSWKNFWFLLQTEWHGTFSFKPNSTHLNWCKRGGTEKQPHQVQLKTATHSENCWGMELPSQEICAACTLPYPTPISNGITVFCCFSCLIQLLFQHFSQFYTTQNFQKDTLSFPDRQNFLSLMNAQLNPLFTSAVSLQRELAGPLCGSGWLSGAMAPWIAETSPAFLSPWAVVNNLTQQLQRGSWEQS